MDKKTAIIDSGATGPDDIRFYSILDEEDV